MKYFLALILMLFNFACAIEWVNLQSAKGKTIALDKDSIKEYQGYYFYNVKMYTNGLDDIVITMQCRISHPFCARIKHCKSSEYDEMDGNYTRITDEPSKNLEPITYESRAYAAYKKVKELTEVKPKITF